MKRLRKELDLIKPIYDILNNNEEWFDLNWNKQLSIGKSEPATDEEIQLVLLYTHCKLTELLNYFESIGTNKITRNTLFFFTDYVNYLMEYHKVKFETRYFYQYIFFYNELILGSQRYLSIKTKVHEIEG